MAQPTIYNPAYNFTSYQTANPSRPLPADKLDTELAALKITTDSVRMNMALLQADDGTLKAQMVTTTSLSTSALALLSATTGTVRGTWASATAYVAKDVVAQGTGTYICAAAHTSGVFATDLTAVKWVLLAGSSGSVAFSSLSDVTITAAAASQTLSWNGTKWVNGFVVAANITDATVTFAKMAAAFSITDTGLVGSSHTNVPTTAAAKAYVDAQVSRGTGSPVAAAATTSLTGNTFDYVSVTGNTGITAITLAAAEQCWVVFTGTPLLTHNAVSLILPGAANIAAAAGDRALFRGLNGSNVECLSYVRASGQAVVAGSTAGLAPLASPTFTGVPAAPTAAPGTNTTQLATTAFVAASGTLVKYTSSVVTAFTAASAFTALPFDDTVPTDTEGYEWGTHAHTPASASNRLLIRASVFAGENTNVGDSLAQAIFKDSDSAALSANASTLLYGSGIGALVTEHSMTAGTTSAITFRARVGGDGSNTAININGRSGTRMFGGAAQSKIEVWEFTP